MGTRLLGSYGSLPLAWAVHAAPFVTPAETAGKGSSFGLLCPLGFLPTSSEPLRADARDVFLFQSGLHAAGPQESPHGGAQEHAVPWRRWWNISSAAAAIDYAAADACGGQNRGVLTGTWLGHLFPVIATSLVALLRFLSERKMAHTLRTS